ncbi:phospholipid carrier-dependent glycosyltransferase [Candidatus Woesearchaeota archaeon]|jgi:4-amino-4-deoxy-L-arabinose transferase-like glycosyltransferase|nr:phospholipid carrier-dependent glycosyltransferase [Candidatus Woesearchaeota archaeon]
MKNTRIVGEKSGRFKKIEIIMLILILLLAFFVRFHNTNELSGGDDSQFAEMAMFAHEKPYKLIYPSFPDEPTSLRNLHYPRIMAILPLYISILFLGFSKYAIAMPSILFSLGSIFLLYIIVKKQFNEKIAMLSALLLAVSPFHIVFSRSGLLHSQLLFFNLAIFYFVIKYFEGKKDENNIRQRNVKWIYLSALFVLLNITTTEYRGLVPLFALIPYILIKRLDKKTIIHGISAVFLMIASYLLYASIPLLLFNNPHFLETIFTHGKHALGNRPGYSNYLSFFDAIKVMGSYFIFTPFIGLIFVPFVGGIIMFLRRIYKPKYMLWIFFLLSSIVFYIQGQPYIQRQLIFTPVYVVLASVFIVKTFDKLKKGEGTLNYLVLMLLTSSYIVLIPKLFMKFIPEYSNLLPAQINMYYNFLLIPILLTLILFFVMLYLLKELGSNKIFRETCYFVLVVFLIINIVTPVILVYNKMGIYQRPDEISKVAKFLKENNQNEKYGCVAQVHDQTFAYYTKKICARWEYIDVNWLKEQTMRGELKYFVFNLYLGEVGILNRKVYRDLENEMSEVHGWVMENSIDVTEKAGLKADNNYFRIREFVSTQIINN